MKRSSFSKEKIAEVLREHAARATVAKDQEWQDGCLRCAAAQGARLRELADPRRRFGYRRLHALLRLKGQLVNGKKAHRYREEGLAVRHRRSRRWIAVARTPIPRRDGPDSRWSLDFVHDQNANGRKFRVLGIIDDVTKECLAAISDTSLSSQQVERELIALIEQRRPPRAIVKDNATESIPTAVLDFIQAIDWRYITPGKLTQIAFAESFQGRMHDECLNEHPFFSMGHVRAFISGRATDDNTRRSHSAIGYQTLATYTATLNTQRTPAPYSMEGTAPMAVADAAHMRNPLTGDRVANG